MDRRGHLNYPYYAQDIVALSYTVVWRRARVQRAPSVIDSSTHASVAGVSDGLKSCRSCGEEHLAHEAKCPRTGLRVNDGHVGSMVGPYRVGKLIGVGGFGSVHVAEDTRSGALVALKLLHSSLVSDHAIVERFAREAEATLRAGNPHIVRVLDASFASGLVYVALELLHGETVASALRERPLPIAQAVDIAIQMLDGLAVAHDVGVIHRDIKPGNIFLADADGAPRSVVKILDFGIGRMLEAEHDQRLTRTGMQLGTPHFTAPEQAFDAKRSGERADIYSVAATLFTMITGDRPYGNIAPAEWLVHVTNRTPVRRAVSPYGQVSEELAQVIAIGLAIDPAERFQSARAFARSLLDSTPDAPSATRMMETIDRMSTMVPDIPKAIDPSVAQAPTRPLAIVQESVAEGFAHAQPLQYAPNAQPIAYTTAAQPPWSRTAHRPFTGLQIAVILGGIGLLVLGLFVVGALLFIL